MDMFQRMMNPMAMPFQSLLTSSFNPEEIEKKITELKTVEHWLNANVAFVQLSIKTLEYQRTILTAAKGQGGSAAENPFAQFTAWPFPAAGEQNAEPKPTGSPKKRKSGDL